MQALIAALVAVLVFIHYLLWLDENGVRQMHTLRVSLHAQVQENAELAERNKGLDAEVKDLKSGLTALEERARSEMGMVRPDETFYHLLDQPVTHVGATVKGIPPPPRPAMKSKAPVPLMPVPTPAARLTPTSTKPVTSSTSGKKANPSPKKPATAATTAKPVAKPDKPASSPKPSKPAPASTTKPATSSKRHD